MGTVYGTHKMLDRFMRPLTLTTTPSGGEFGWTLKDTSSAGAPTFLCVSGEGLVGTLAASDEAEVLTAYQNNVLPFLLNKLKRIKILAKAAAFDAVTSAVLGIGSAQADDTDTMSINAWFKIVGGAANANTVVVETDDNTTNDDDNATGKSLGTTLKEMVIDFSEGLSKVRFIFDGDPVGTYYDMSAAAATDKVQLFIQHQKASGTGVGVLTIRSVEVEYASAEG